MELFNEEELTELDLNEIQTQITRYHNTGLESSKLRFRKKIFKRFNDELAKYRSVEEKICGIYNIRMNREFRQEILDHEEMAEVATKIENDRILTKLSVQAYERNSESFDARIFDQIHEEHYDEILKKAITRARKTVYDEIKQDEGNRIEQDVRNDIFNAIYTQEMETIKENVTNIIQKEIYTKIRRREYKRIRQQIRNEVYENIYENEYNSIYQNICTSIRNKVSDDRYLVEIERMNNSEVYEMGEIHEIVGNIEI